MGRQTTGAKVKDAVHTFLEHNLRWDVQEMRDVAILSDVSDYHGQQLVRLQQRQDLHHVRLQKPALLRCSLHIVMAKSGKSLMPLAVGTNTWHIGARDLARTAPRSVARERLPVHPYNVPTPRVVEEIVEAIKVFPLTAGCVSICTRVGTDSNGHAASRPNFALVPVTSKCNSRAPEVQRNIGARSGRRL